MNLTPVASVLEERHTIAIIKRDVSVIIEALAAFYMAKTKAKKPKEELEEIQDLHTFFTNVYKSKGVI